MYEGKREPKQQRLLAPRLIRLYSLSSRRPSCMMRFGWSSGGIAKTSQPSLDIMLTNAREGGLACCRQTIDRSDHRLSIPLTDDSTSPRISRLPHPSITTFTLSLQPEQRLHTGRKLRLTQTKFSNQHPNPHTSKATPKPSRSRRRTHR